MCVSFSKKRVIFAKNSQKVRRMIGLREKENKKIKNKNRSQSFEKSFGSSLYRRDCNLG